MISFETISATRFYKEKKRNCICFSFCNNNKLFSVETTFYFIKNLDEFLLSLKCSSENFDASSYALQKLKISEIPDIRFPKFLPKCKEIFFKSSRMSIPFLLILFFLQRNVLIQSTIILDSGEMSAFEYAV